MIKACRSRWERRGVLALGWMLSTDVMNGFSQHGGCFTHSRVRKRPSEPCDSPHVCTIAAAAPLGMQIDACFPECTSVYRNWDTHFQAGLRDPVGAVKRLDPEVEGNSGKLRMETKVS